MPKSVSWAVRTSKRKSLPSDGPPQKLRRKSSDCQRTLTQIQYILPVATSREGVLRPVSSETEGPTGAESKRQQSLTQIQFVPRTASTLIGDCLPLEGPGMANQVRMADSKTRKSRDMGARRGRKKQRNTITQMDYLVNRGHGGDEVMDLIKEPETDRQSKRQRAEDFPKSRTEVSVETRDRIDSGKNLEPSPRRRRTQSLGQKENRPPSPQIILETPKKNRLVVPSSQSPDSIPFSSCQTFHTPCGNRTPLRDLVAHSPRSKPRQQSPKRKIRLLKDKSQSEWEVPETSQIETGIVLSSQFDEDQMEVLEKEESPCPDMETTATSQKPSKEKQAVDPDPTTSLTDTPVPAQQQADAPELHRMNTIPDSEDEGDEILGSTIPTHRASQPDPETEALPDPHSPPINHHMILVPSSPPMAATASSPNANSSIVQHSKPIFLPPTQSIRPVPLVRPSQISTQAPTQMSWPPPSIPRGYRSQPSKTQRKNQASHPTSSPTPGNPTQPNEQNSIAQVLIKSSPHSSPIPISTILPQAPPSSHPTPSLDEDLDPKSPDKARKELRSSPGRNGVEASESRQSALPRLRLSDTLLGESLPGGPGSGAFGSLEGDEWTRL